MHDGGKKTAGAAGAIGLAVAAFFARGGDDVARVVVHSAGAVDHAVLSGARSAGEVSHGLSGVGRYGDDLAELGRHGEPALSPLGRPGRTGASFGGAAFEEEVALLDPHGVATLTDETPAFTDDAFEALADVSVELAESAASFAGEDDEVRATPVFVSTAHAVAITSAEVIALSARPLPQADRSVSSLRELDELLRSGSPSSLALLVVATPVGSSEGAEAARRRVTGAGDEASRTVEAVLLRAAQHGRRAMVVACEARDRPEVCLADAVWVARAASYRPPSEVAEVLLLARRGSPSHADIALHRLHGGQGGSAGMWLATSPPQ